MSIRQLVFALFLFSGFTMQAQTTRVSATNTNSWWMYFGNHQVSDRWGIHAEAQFRLSEGVSDWQQLLLRTGLNYYAKQVRYTLGYAFVKTFPYGDFPVTSAFPEHRMWEQAQLNQTLGNVKLNHRYRLEQRWIGNSTTGDFEDVRYENRFRYMLRATIPLGKDKETGKFYLGFYDELFVNAGKEVGYNIFDQNRAYAALGFKLGKIGRVELGYLYQLLQQRKLVTTTSTPQLIFENNHTLQVGLYSDLSFL
jgi:hypothetical protein